MDVSLHEQILDTLPDPVTIQDRDLNIIYQNEAMRRIYGPHIGSKCYAIYERREHVCEGCGVQKAFETRAATMVFRVAVMPDGTTAYWENRCFPLFDDKGNIIAGVEVCRDVTGRVELSEEVKARNCELGQLTDQLSRKTRELEEAIGRAKEMAAVADAANRAKSVFLANMSHELRTPLNAVLGFSQLMKSEPGLSVRQKESLDIINRSGEHLLNLINNVLDISKIESGRVTLEMAPMDLHQLLHEMKSLMYARAMERGLDFIVEQGPDLPPYINFDQGKLRQVLINLIGNAVKYTKSGWVILRAAVVKDAAPESPDRVRLRFEVEDTGPGIREEDRERIFTPFVQVGQQPPTEAGTGLGLAICKQYVELMGGTIGVVSASERGSIFGFEIPVVALPFEVVTPVAQRGRVVGLAEGQPRYRLLIAEDHPENRRLLHAMLEPLGFDLREVTNGEEAMALFEEWHPDLIWMDIRMPVVDGLEATKRIKATEAGIATKIVAVTAHALEEERSEIMAAGCDDFIRKPFGQCEILDMLTKHLGVRFVYEEEVAPRAVEARLDPAALAGLPAESLSELEEALSRIDIGAVNRAIEKTRTHDPALADGLAAVTRDLQFGRILQLIRSVQAENGGEDRGGSTE